ncbi:MAG TPA: proline--tRNA ligase [Candidatus Bathyarchaeia archaeon]|nr:proline--tRNA ligase [Candidatus Bathyarchaeia archaeon]
MSSKDLGITVKKADNLSEWYTQVVMKAQLADYAGPKGFMVLMPYGFSIWESVKAFFDTRIKAIGHKNAYFPLLIPERLLKKESDHFAGFTPQVFWVTHSGDDELGERLAVRPTSETIINESYSKWVKSWRDLPVLINIWNSVVRAEITSTRPFLRTTEFLWQEGHTVHATEQEAEQEVMTILELYRRLIEEQLAIPVLVGKKTEREKFKGAVYTTTLEAMMPDGKAIQMGTSHHLGQNFSKPFEIKFLGKDELEHFAWTTSWGFSWRVLGAMILAHGDDKGLILPPKIAPTQVVIVPIHYKETDSDQILSTAKRVAHSLEKHGVSAFVDDRTQYTPGWKYHDWEMKGVPLRIEIGPRDIQSKQLTVVRRDTGKKSTISEEEPSKAITMILDEIQTSLYAKALKMREELTSTADNMTTFRRLIEDKGGFVQAFLCDDEDCELRIQAETGATVRLVPFKPDTKANCIYCGRGPAKQVYFARSY